MLTHNVHFNPHIHIAKNFLALVRAAFSERQEVPFTKQKILDSEIQIAQATIDESTVQSVKERIEQMAKESDIDYTYGAQPLILVNPNASELLVQRRWPPERFSQLIQGIHSRWPHALVLITGSPDEAAYADAINQTTANTLNSPDK